MPRMTARYGFECKVWQFADWFSLRLTGTIRAFLMVLDDDGSVRMVRFERPEEGWREYRESLKSAGVAYLFYDPFDYPEWAFLCWHNVSRSTMERLVGSPFEAADFEASLGLEPPIALPSSWSVMF